VSHTLLSFENNRVFVTVSNRRKIVQNARMSSSPQWLRIASCPLSLSAFGFVAAALFAFSLASDALGAQIDEQDESEWMNCYAIVVGKACTVDGSVLYAHNEDSGANRAVNHWKVPRHLRAAGERQTLVDGGTLASVPATQAYIWCQMPGLKYSDSYLNESGVAVASNGCQSREDHPQLTDAGIGLMLRRIVAERATCAREGLEIACELLSTFGYQDSGRTLVIADAEEAWLLNIVRGKHYAAARVPDDKCAVLANHYTIHQIEAEDQENYRTSPGLIEYAQERGWYEPERDGAFDFATVYGKDGARNHRSNIRRAWRGNELVSKSELPEEWFQPTFITPSNKLGPLALMEILRDHYEGSKYDISEGYQECSPYEMKQPTICAGRTSFSTVFQLRSHMPASIGAVMWIAMCRPDTSVFVPWYAGIEEVPPGFGNGAAEMALAKHFEPSYMELGQPENFAATRALQSRIESDYGKFYPSLDKARDAFELDLLGLQAEVEACALRLYSQIPTAASELLTAYTLGQQARANSLIRELDNTLR
jgi:dipeptidase